MNGNSPKLHPNQALIARSKARFKVIRAGRRSGKSSLEIEIMLVKAMSKKNRRIFYIAPTMKQSRSIIWELLKSRLAGLGTLNESRLEATVPTQDGGTSTINVFGFEARENFRGVSADHITFDEVDSMPDFFIGWQEIFRPALIDTRGSADFIGTPKSENPNLRRLEKEGDEEWAFFNFTTADNPHIPPEEIVKARNDMDAKTYQQEILAEYVENEGALFKYAALLDMFTNTITKTNQRYLTVDIADDGSDKTVFALWNGLQCLKIDLYAQLQTDGIISTIREMAAAERVPYSQIAVDAIGVGAGVASSPLLAGIVGFKSSYSAIRADIDPTRLPNVHYLKNAPLATEYKNLRSQCIFILAGLVNTHAISVTIEDQAIKTKILEELSTYQDASEGDGKRMATQKEDVKAIIGRSPDISDALFMRMYFVIRGKLSTGESEDSGIVRAKLTAQFARNEARQTSNESR